MIMTDGFYLWYILMIMLGIVAAIIRQARDTYKVTVIVIAVLAINAMNIHYQIYQYPVILLSGFALFFIAATAMSYFSRSKKSKK